MQHLPTDPSQVGRGFIREGTAKGTEIEKCAYMVLIKRMLSELSQQTSRWPGQGNKMVSVKKKKSIFM